jgi:hypothetical protein
MYVKNRKNEPVKNRKNEHNRRCTICDSNKTYVKSNVCEHWRIDKDTGLYICSKCYAKKYYQSHKEKCSESNLKILS